MSGTVRIAIGVLLAAAGVGCRADLGECDPAAAREVVYDQCGRPAYRGQAIVQSSCGHGGYCHSRGAEGELRRGAPHGLNWDMRLASQDGQLNAAELETLRLGQLTMFENRSLAWDMVDRGVMPPTGGDATVGVFDDPLRPRFERADGTPILGLDVSEEERDALRNWLVCGLPVIERTELPEGMPGYALTVGSAVPGRAPADAPPECDVPDPNFGDIYRAVLGPQCGQACHRPDAGELFAQHMLDMSTADAAYTNLMMPAMGVDTGGAPVCASSGLTRVVPGDPMASLLYLKVAGMQPCGERMPLGGTPLPAATIGAFEQWIAGGAAR